MTKFTTGLLAGGVMAVVGVSYAMNDKRARRKMMRTSKKMAAKAGRIFDDVSDSVEDMF